ncbi:MAG: DUF1801 domain-containing protein [Candidatus Methanomethylicus sp.]|nr:DUF1801 domain-containing protein [Candidatus Methanomethylicus sp.]
MKTQKLRPSTIDEYIAGFPSNIQVLLNELKETIQKAAPDAVETISYQMPAFRLNGILVYFAAFKDHIGFFPTSSGVSRFKDELSCYKLSKGTIRFPLSDPLPKDLVTRIVQFRVQENLEKSRSKGKRG